jgi:hypothetical protein
MKLSRAIILLAEVAVACAAPAPIELPLKTDAVRDAASAIRIGIDACVSKRVVQPPPDAMHATLHGGYWHVWEAGRACKVFSNDVRAADGKPSECSICVT